MFFKNIIFLFLTCWIGSLNSSSVSTDAGPGTTLRKSEQIAPTTSAVSSVHCKGFSPQRFLPVSTAEAFKAKLLRLACAALCGFQCGTKSSLCLQPERRRRHREGFPLKEGEFSLMCQKTGAD